MVFKRYTSMLLATLLLVIVGNCNRIEFYGTDGKIVNTNIADKKELISTVTSTFGLSSKQPFDKKDLDMFRRPTANVIFVVSQADAKSVIDGSLNGLVSQWSSHFGANTVRRFIDETNDGELYAIDSDKYSLLAKNTDQSRVKNFLRQLKKFESELLRTSTQANEPTLLVILFTAMRDLNPEEAVEARQLIQNTYIPNMMSKIKGRVAAQVIYDEKLTNVNVIGRKLMSAPYTVLINSSSNNTNTTVPSAYAIAEWQQTVWTCIILIFSGIFAIWFIMQIDYSQDQMAYAAELTKAY
jgi:hypothetical protein